MYNCFLRPNPFVVDDDGAWVEMEAVVRWALINLGFPLVGGRKSIYTFQRSCEGACAEGGGGGKSKRDLSDHSDCDRGTGYRQKGYVQSKVNSVNV